jgi:hypothetical protein
MLAFLTVNVMVCVSRRPVIVTVYVPVVIPVVSMVVVTANSPST